MTSRPAGFAASPCSSQHRALAPAIGATLVLVALASLPLGRSVMLRRHRDRRRHALCGAGRHVCTRGARVPDAVPLFRHRLRARRGRLGGILSSFAGGLLLAQAGAAGFFGGVGAVMVLTLIAVLLLRRHIARLQAQEAT